MAMKTFVTSDVLTASDTNVYLVNTIVAIKTATESVTSSTVLQDDDQLTVSVLASSTYEVFCQVFYDGNPAGDIKYDFVGPAGATFVASCHRLTTGATALSDATAPMSVDQYTMGTPIGVGAVTTGNTATTTFRGLLVVSSTAGTFKLQWAQNTSSGTATRVFANSYMVLRRVS